MLRSDASLETPPDAGLRSLAELTVADCLPWVGESFALHRREGGTLRLLLIEAAAAASKVPAHHRAPFALLFRCPELPSNQHIRQGIYRMEHPGFGTVELFLTPVTPDAVGMRYEAVFG